ncbi:MAG: xanthine dehydrogenase small subunit [Geminicoccaceae bacterium]
MARSDIRFLLGFEPMSLAGCDPNRTVLDWLREDMGLTGTKEGCAEGDCGACTVVLVDLEGGALRYRAVNACILFLPQLDGRQLITVEQLKDETGAPHPIQQAMVDHHASQCGFCTPGFVMSLLALAKGGSAAGPDFQREAVCDAIAGNLCRCTGYRPILDSSDALDHALDDVFDRRSSQTIAALGELDVSEELAIESHGRRYHAPTSLDSLATAYAPSRARLLAGGTDVGLWVTKQHRDLDDVIDVTRVAELKRFRETETHLVIGAGCTYQQIHAVIRDHWDDFGELVRRIGGAQVRAAGTIGGNIANGSPIGDTMPALIALGANIVLRKGERRREMPLEDLYLGYRKTALELGEFVAEIHIPLPAAGAVFRCYKISKRFDQDISAVLGAFALALSDDGKVKKMRIGFGGMAAVPKRAVETERAVLGKPWTEATIEAGQAALAAEFSPISDMRASADYRLTAAQNLLKKVFIETTEPKAETRVAEASL